VDNTHLRIALDARSASHPQRGGFRTYTENLIRQLPRVDPENHYLFYSDRTMDCTAFQDLPNVVVKVVRPPLPLVGVAWREQVQLPWWLTHDHVDLVHFPASTASLVSACPMIVTIHDAIPWNETPQVTGIRLGDAIRRRGIHFYDSRLSLVAAQRARFVITDSENSKDDIVNRTAICDDRIRVIYPAPATLFGPIREPENLYRHRTAMHMPFILSLVSASPRKNARGLVEAYAHLDSALIEKYHLVLVWTHGLWRNEIARLADSYGLQNRVVFLEGVSDEELCGLYNAASLFVFPSLYEGFGLPPLEAMACGTPVVASNNSSMPEVLGDAAVLVDPHDTCALGAAITRVLSDDAICHELEQRGLRRVQRYSWEKCARETAQVYCEALSEVREKSVPTYKNA
jgi:glycosyltransferase involved in cell wall biosynthesis